MKISTLTLNPALDRTMYFSSPFKAGELNRCAKSVVTLGGKGINVSRFFGKLGIDVPAYGFSGGSNGDEMKKLLAEEGITSYFVETKAPTRMNIKMIDSDSNCTEANEKGGPIEEAELDLLISNIEKHTESQQLFFMCGSIPHPVDNSVYNFLIKRLKKKDVRVVLDCDGEALRNGLEAQPYLIKPNLFELSQLVGKELKTTKEAVYEAKKIYDEKGVEVLCTMSEKGAFYVGKRGLFTVTSPHVKLAGFTGAGDSFLSAFIYMTQIGGDIEKSLKFASSAAAAKVELPGSTLPEAKDMNKFTDMISVVGIQ